jgi:hypothetical protein
MKFGVAPTHAWVTVPPCCGLPEAAAVPLLVVPLLVVPLLLHAVAAAASAAAAATPAARCIRRMPSPLLPYRLVVIADFLDNHMIGIPGNATLEIGIVVKGAG